MPLVAINGCYKYVSIHIFILHDRKPLLVLVTQYYSLTRWVTGCEMRVLTACHVCIQRCLADSAGTVSWTALATIVKTPSMAVAMVVLGSLGTACSDVVVDSIVVERSRGEPQVSSGAVQLLVWACCPFLAWTACLWHGLPAADVCLALSVF